MRTLWQVFQHKSTSRSDAALLQAFSREKCEKSFADLVARHSGMVLGICQRILGHTQDAEDAFQATFLVLAQKAAGLHTEGPLSPWLFGVARRVALKARSRRPADQPVPLEFVEPAANEEANSMATASEWSELRPIIDDEVARLPAPYRTVLILCHMNGMTKAETARKLGCPEGTVSSRLMRAKELLRHRLTRRGITLTSLATLDAVLAPCVASASLIHGTVGLAMHVTLGVTITTSVSSSVLSLAQGTTQAMMFTKIKFAALALVVSAGLTAGSSYVAGGWGQDKATAPKSDASTLISPRNPENKTTSSKPAETAKPAASNNAGTALQEIISSSSEASDVLNSISKQLAPMFNTEVSLEEHLQFIEKQTGLVCILDHAAFRDHLGEMDIKEMRKQLIHLPRLNNQSTATILQTLLDGLTISNQTVPSTFLLRRGTLVIVPKEYVNHAASRIQVALDTSRETLTLMEAFDRLSQDTGISIIVDSRSTETARGTKVTINFRNLKLINAVKLLANMADLSIINIDGSLYVSTPENCHKMEEETNRTVRGPN